MTDILKKINDHLDAYRPPVTKVVLTSPTQMLLEDCQQEIQRLREALELIADFDNWKKGITAVEGRESWLWLGSHSVILLALKALGKEERIDDYLKETLNNKQDK